MLFQFLSFRRMLPKESHVGDIISNIEDLDKYLIDNILFLILKKERLFWKIEESIYDC